MSSYSFVFLFGVLTLLTAESLELKNGEDVPEIDNLLSRWCEEGCPLLLNNSPVDFYAQKSLLCVLLEQRIWRLAQSDALLGKATTPLSYFKRNDLCQPGKLEESSSLHTTETTTQHEMFIKWLNEARELSSSTTTTEAFFQDDGLNETSNQVVVTSTNVYNEDQFSKEVDDIEDEMTSTTIIITNISNNDEAAGVIGVNREEKMQNLDGPFVVVAYDNNTINAGVFLCASKLLVYLFAFLAGVPLLMLTSLL